jgi:hypothetical protein
MLSTADTIVAELKAWCAVEVASWLNHAIIKLDANGDQTIKPCSARTTPHRGQTSAALVFWHSRGAHERPFSSASKSKDKPQHKSGRFPGGQAAFSAGWLHLRAESLAPAPEGVLPSFVEHPKRGYYLISRTPRNLANHLAPAEESSGLAKG